MDSQVSRRATVVWLKMFAKSFTHAGLVVIAMSGGVDSSVTAKLLADRVGRHFVVEFKSPTTKSLGCGFVGDIYAELGYPG
jgi:PP-loop superfamily ATP-utilizing enzyme